MWSKLGTDEFDYTTYQKVCNEITNTTTKLADSLKQKLYTCANDDLKKGFEVALDLFTSALQFKCSMTEKELLCE